MSKQYYYIEKSYTAQPRSKRRRETGSGSDTSNGSTIFTSTSDGISLSPEGITDHRQLTGVKSTVDDYSEYSRDIHLTAEDADKLKLLNSETLEQRYLRKDIDDRAAGNITFNKNIILDGEHDEPYSIYSKSGANDFNQKDGFRLFTTGDAWLRDVNIKKDALFAGNLSSPSFTSGFPEGSGWALTWREIVNAAGIAAQRNQLELDDLTVRGTLRVYEMVISQLLGENGTIITADMMKVKSVDTVNQIIYLDTEEGALFNPFREDDIVQVKHFTGMPTAENGYTATKEYEFVVEETHIGGLGHNQERIDWIKYKNFVGDISRIAERDTLVRVDNLSDPDRKGIIKQTSVEPGSPYMDIIYGLKTDPGNAVRSRFGKLDGMITPYWGQLQGYGLMCDNLYAKGRFLLHTGEDVHTRFEVIEGRLESEMKSLRQEITDKDNVLQNSSFATDTNLWEVLSDISFFTVEQKFLYFNNTFYSDKKQIASIVTRDGLKVLRMKNSNLKQDNKYLRLKPKAQLAMKDGTSVWPTYYISFRYRVHSAGTLTVGFNGQPISHTAALAVTEAYDTYEISGSWDGTGDFNLKFTGEIDIYSLAMAHNSIEDMKAEFMTRIVQTEKEILLQASAIETVGERVTTAEGNMSVMAGDINIWGSRVVNVEGRMTTAENSIINVLPDKISAISTRVTATETGVLALQQAGFITTATGNTLFAHSGNVISMINQSSEEITIKAEKVNLVGKVTFSMLADSAKSDIKEKVVTKELDLLATTLTEKIDKKVGIDDLKDTLAYKTQIEVAELGETIIKGGHIVTSLIDVDDLYVKSLAAVRGTIAGFTIESNGISSTNNYTTEGTNAKFFLHSGGNTPFLGFSSTGKWVGIGLNVSPATMGIDGYLGRFENTVTNSGEINYGIYIKVANAKENRALEVVGDVKVTGSFASIGGVRYVDFQTTGGSDTILLNYKRCQQYVIKNYASSSYLLHLPSYNYNNEIGYSDSYIIDIVADHANSGEIVVNVRGSATWIRDNSGNIVSQNSGGNSNGNIVLAKGDAVRLLYMNQVYYILSISK